MNIGYLIEPTHRRITGVDFTGNETMRQFIGGSFTLAGWLGARRNSPLYVPLGGLYNAGFGFFQLGGSDTEPLRGNGLVVGPELLEDADGILRHAPPTISLPGLRAGVTFLSHHEAEAWIYERRGEVCTTVNGNPVDTWGDLWRGVPPPPGLAWRFAWTPHAGPNAHPCPTCAQPVTPPAVRSGLLASQPGQAELDVTVCVHCARPCWVLADGAMVSFTAEDIVRLGRGDPKAQARLLKQMARARLCAPYAPPSHASHA